MSLFVCHVVQVFILTLSGSAQSALIWKDVLCVRAMPFASIVALGISLKVALAVRVASFLDVFRAFQALSALPVWAALN
jgi:hypothetical protein